MSNPLEDLFKVTEEDAATFLDSIKDLVHSKTDEFDPNKFLGEADMITTQEFISQQSGKIKISHGPHGDHYVFHISPIPNAKIRCTEEQFIHGAVMLMNQTLPRDIMVDIFLPQSDWDIKEYTYKAYNYYADWRFNDRNLKKIITDVLEGLNAIS